MVNLITALKLSRANADERCTVTVFRVHVCLNLKDKARKIRFTRIHCTLVRFTRHRSRSEIGKSIQKLTHAKTRHSTAEEHWAHFTLQEKFMVERIHAARHHVIFFTELVHPVFSAKFYKLRIVRTGHLQNFLVTGLSIINIKRIVGDAIHALEKFTDTDRQGKWNRLDF